MTERRFRRLVGLIPPLVLVLWVAGIAHFRGASLEVLDYALLAAAAFALQTIARRLSRPRPLPPLPPGLNPIWLTAQAAAMIAVLAAVIGGVGEWFVQTFRPSETPWALRTLWHTACTYVIAYCTFLPRVLAGVAAKDAPPPDQKGS